MSIENLEQRLGKLVDYAGYFAAFCALALVLLVSSNVLLRYAFASGSVGLQELEWHLISPIALLGMAYAMRSDAHVRVDILFEKMIPRWQGAIDLLTAFLLVSVSLICVKLSLPYVEHSHSMNEGSPDPGGLPFRFLLKAFIPLGFFFLALQGFLSGLKTIVRIRQLEKEPKSEPETTKPAAAAQEQ